MKPWRRRTSWLLTAVALLASPGVAAPWLHHLHHCATEMPAASMAHHHGSSHQDSQDNDETSDQCCQCIGLCHSGVQLPGARLTWAHTHNGSEVGAARPEARIHTDSAPNPHLFARPPPFLG